MRYRVYGYAEVEVAIDVEADNADDALEVALDNRSYLSSFCGNGGVDKLIGVDGYDESVYPIGEIRYERAEAVDAEDEDSDNE
jgi:hypothetical protein